MYLEKFHEILDKTEEHSTLKTVIKPPNLDKNHVYAGISF